MKVRKACQAPGEPAERVWRVQVMLRAQIADCPRWRQAFGTKRKDHRYFEVVQDTIDQGFDYRYFAVTDEGGEIQAIQPFFITDQDLLYGASRGLKIIASAVRMIYPRFFRMRTLMIGCAAGEGHLDAEDSESRFLLARTLAASVLEEARKLKANLVVFKEFTALDRPALSWLQEAGFTRAPSMPMTRVRLGFDSFEAYLRDKLSHNMRSKLRRKYKASEHQAALKMRAVTDPGPYLEEIYQLYLAVYKRAKLRFEKLTPAFFHEVGKRMPDKACFFLWFQEDRLVAFNLCMTDSTSICSEYIGLDYSVAFDLHLYYVVVRDVMQWSIEHGFQWYYSTALNYEPKYHLRHELYPLDLYVKHATPAVNFILKHALRFMEPARNDKVLPRFENYRDLYTGTQIVES